MPGSRSVNSTLDRGPNLWPLGDCQVQLFIDQKKDPSRLIDFKVTD